MNGINLGLKEYSVLFTPERFKNFDFHQETKNFSSSFYLVNNKLLLRIVCLTSSAINGVIIIYGIHLRVRYCFTLMLCLK